MLKKIIILSLAVSQANISASDTTPDEYTTPEFKAFIATTAFEENNTEAFKRYVFKKYPRGWYCNNADIINKLALQFVVETGNLPFTLPESTPGK